jgi:hypothetical protein
MIWVAMSTQTIDDGNVLHLDDYRGRSGSQVEGGSDFRTAEFEQMRALIPEAAREAAEKTAAKLTADHRAELASQRRAIVISGAVVLGLGYAIRRGRK